MNWKLIFQLSVFGLIMAFATVSLIPANVEPVFWLVIFIFCAYVIAKVCTGNYFLQGLFVSLINCVWITSAHIFFYKTYIANHKEMADSFAQIPGPLSVHPRLTMAIIGTFIGVISGLILGLFAFIASLIVKKK
ncbi:MAG: hypothetical protein ACXVAY_11730 [Mucilaginibacter sp.]